MSDGDALLRAVLACPEDDSARLVYADWLQENDQEAWAELIRVQVELARPAPEHPASMKIDLLSSEGHVQRIEEFRAARTGGRAGTRPTRARTPRGGAGHDPAAGGMVRRGRSGADASRRPGRRVPPPRPARESTLPAEVWLLDAHLLLVMHPIEQVQLTTEPLYGDCADRSPADGPTEYLYTLSIPPPLGLAGRHGALCRVDAPRA